jgi:F0F1-type ATP synthase epsilon subunit
MSDAFAVRVLNPKHTIYEGVATSVFLPGDLAEFEIMPYHAPIISLLKKGTVVIDWKVRIPIQRGMVKFYRNECMVLVEE